MNISGKVFAAVGVLSLVIGAGFASSVAAMRFTSTDYIIDTGVLNNVGGDTSSNNYRLTSSGGEAAIGNGASGSYRLAAGYVAQVIKPAITVKTQPSNLAAYYPLDENSGTIAHDNSINASNGELKNGATWTAGKIGTAVNFVGASNTAVSLGNGSQLQASTVSIEAWVKTTNTTAGTMIVGKQNAWGITSGNTASGYAGIYNYTTASTPCVGTTSITDGNWHHVVAVIQSGVANGTKLYVDGALQATCQVTIVNQSSGAAIGALASFANAYTGAIDQVKIFNRALSLNEIAAEYSAQNAGVETGLTLQTIIPGTSNTANFDVITATSGSSYTLAINQDHNLQNGAYTIPAIGSSIGSPAVWNEGTTKGLGFTLVSTNATAIPASWNSGNSYAALPGVSTSFYSRTGIQSSNDVLGMRLRLDVTTTQASGNYTNTMQITGTANP